jgi:hypothetical protein
MEPRDEGFCRHLLCHAVLFDKRLLGEVELERIVGAQRHVQTCETDS